MTIADLTVGAPGRPDQPATGAFTDDPDVAEEVSTGVGLPTVTGLVRSASAILAQIIGAQYPERPGIGAMTDEECTGIANALVSWSTRSPALATALEKSDALAVAFYMAGWAGRTGTDIVAVRRERKANDDRWQNQVFEPGAPEGGRPVTDRDASRDGAGGIHPDSGGIP